MSSYYELFLYYLQTQLSGMVLETALSHKIMHNLGLFTV